MTDYFNSLYIDLDDDRRLVPRLNLARGTAAPEPDGFWALDPTVAGSTQLLHELCALEDFQSLAVAWPDVASRVQNLVLPLTRAAALTSLRILPIAPALAHQLIEAIDDTPLDPHRIHAARQYIVLRLVRAYIGEDDHLPWPQGESFFNGYFRLLEPFHAAWRSHLAQRRRSAGRRDLSRHMLEIVPPGYEFAPGKYSTCTVLHSYLPGLAKRRIAALDPPNLAALAKLPVLEAAYWARRFDAHYGEKGLAA